MPHYSVTTPEQYHSYGYDEPPEYYAEFVWVDAQDERQAKIEAVRKLREQKSDWTKDDMGNPFVGLKVAEAKCPHGSCWCEPCAEDPNYVECRACLDAWEREEHA